LKLETEALKEDGKNPWLEQVQFPMGFLLSAHSWKSIEQPPLQYGHTIKQGSFPQVLGKTTDEKAGEKFLQKL
jgi:hypothetical protein